MATVSGTRPPKPWLFRRHSSREIWKNLTSVSSSFLPAFGTAPEEKYGHVKKYIVFPYDRRYRLWRTLLVLLVIYSSWASTLEVAFKKATSGALGIIDVLVDFFFAVDIVLTFFVAYLDKSTYVLVDDHRKIALRYVGRLHFPMDVISTIPFQFIYRVTAGRVQNEAFAFLYLLRLWRIRHVNAFFKRLEKDTRFTNYFFTRLAKLVGVALSVVHLAACVFFYLAYRYKKPEETFIGALIPDFKDKSMWLDYLYSFYLATVTIGNIGYGDIHSMNQGEMIFNVMYMIFNMGLRAYIVGNITDLVIDAAIRTLNMRSAINEILKFARKNQLPEGLKEQMLAHMQLKFETEELRQEGLLQDLPKAIRTAIHQDLFRGIVENAYLFRGASEYFTVQLVSEMKAVYFPPKVEIVLQNETPTDFYILVSGSAEVLTHDNGTEKCLTSFGPSQMAGEIGVMFNISQPFTIRCKELSQLLRISHHNMKKMIQPGSEDGKIIISNFIEYLKGLKEDVIKEVPFLPELLAGLRVKETESGKNTGTGKTVRAKRDTYTKGREGTSRSRNKAPIRVIIHGHHPSEGSDQRGKLVNLPDSIEDLLGIAEEKFGKIKGSKILMDDGAELDELDALRENDHLFIV